MDEGLRTALLDVLDAAEGERSLDTAFRLLSDAHVRYVLYYLSDRSSASLDELAGVVAGLEATERRSVATRTDHERIRIRLHHAVLPKLEENGVVEFDPGEETVTRVEDHPLGNRLEAPDR